MRGSTIALLVLATEVFIGSATGIQRTILSIEVSRTLGVALSLTPIVTFGIFKALADYFAALLAQSRGRSRVLRLGALLYAIGALSVLLLPQPFNFFLGNVLIGAGEGFVFAASAMILRSLLGLEKSALSFSYIESACYLGYALGAYAGGAALVLGGSAAPLLLIAVFSISALVVSLRVREVKKAEQFSGEESWGSGEKFSLKLIYRNPSTLSALLAAHVAKTADSIVWGVLPLFVVARGWGSYYAGYAQALILVMWSLMMPFWSYYSDRVGRKLISTAGLLFTAGLLLLLPSSGSPAETLLVAMLIGIGYAMYYPILPTPVADLTPPGARDVAIGLYRAVRDSGYFTGALLGSMLLSAPGDHIRETFMNTGVLLALSATTFSVIFRETRPTWPFLDLVIEHVKIIRDVLRLHIETIRCFFEGRQSEMEENVKRIKTLERRADTLKREIVWRIWSSLLPSSGRAEFEKLVGEIDKVAGAVLESSERLLWAKRGPELTRAYELLVGMLLETERLADRLVENLKLLSLSPLYAVRAAVEIDAGERRVDELRTELIHELRRLVNEGKIDTLTFLSLVEVANLIELASDDFQDAADLIRVIAYRHAATPLR
ncbi:MAG: MFS transporter [Thermofilum sp.]